MNFLDIFESFRVNILVIFGIFAIFDIFDIFHAFDIFVILHIFSNESTRLVAIGLVE